MYLDISMIIMLLQFNVSTRNLAINLFFLAESRPEDMYWILSLVETDPDHYVR